MDEFRVWDTDRAIKTNQSSNLHVCVFHSLRLADTYKISIDDSRYLQHRCKLLTQTATERAKARLATILIDRSAEGEKEPLIDSKMIDHAIEHARQLPVSKRAHRLLRFMTHREIGVGESFHFFLEESLYEVALGVSESTKEMELEYFLTYLKEAGFIKETSELEGGFVVTVQGYESVEREFSLERSNRVFVALWFNNPVKELWITIKRVVEHAGYEPVRVDLEKFEGLIDDKIVAEIRTAKFVIADLTHDDDGQRGSVYYEAGFARGLNKSVIQTVRQDHLDENVPKRGVAFDLAHYPVIPWCENDLSKFEDTLLDRIISRFGKHA